MCNYSLYRHLSACSHTQKPPSWTGGMAGSLPPLMASLPWVWRVLRQSAAVFIDEVVNTCVTQGLLSSQCVTVRGVKGRVKII